MADEIDSLSIFVGTGECNANCAHCAGKVHRKYAPKKDGILDKNLIYKTLENCYSKGARSLTISSSGEPTLSPLAVTKLLILVNNCERERIKYNPISIYTNGIRIGEDEDFCNQYLPLWKKQGLTRVYVTVHDVNEKRNAEIYRIKNYPSLKTIISRIHDAGLLVRGNLVLSKKTICTLEQFVSAICDLKNLGVDLISAWPIRDKDDKLDLQLAPFKEELDKMEEKVKGYEGVRLLREKNRVLYETSKKLTLFLDGALSNTWCN